VILNKDGASGGDAMGLVVDPYVKLSMNSKASLKLDAAYTVNDLSDSGTWNLPITLLFVYSY
jgi:hypothetical protein